MAIISTSNLFVSLLGTLQKLQDWLCKCFRDEPFDTLGGLRRFEGEMPGKLLEKEQFWIQIGEGKKKDGPTLEKILTAKMCHQKPLF